MIYMNNMQKIMKESKGNERSQKCIKYTIYSEWYSLGNESSKICKRKRDILEIYITQNYT